MLGMEEVFIQVMGQDNNIEEKKLIEDKSVKQIGKINFFSKRNMLAMFGFLLSIGIVLINVISLKETKKTNASTDNNIIFSLNEEKDMQQFIEDYYKARTNLDYEKIFSAFGRDYYKEENNKNIENVKTLIRYEKVYIVNYNNFKLYTAKGLYQNEYICIVTYEMQLGFTTDTLPNITLFYLKKDEKGNFIIEENYNVERSKYVLKAMNEQFVKQIYNEIYEELERKISTNDATKLVYNSLRQWSINIGTKVNYENYNYPYIYYNPRYDLIKNADAIKDAILQKKSLEQKQKNIDDFLNGISEGLSKNETK